MRLINTKTLQLVEVSPDLITGYAILSHRWLGEEITYAEFACPTAETRSKPGYRKIEKLCEYAMRDNLQYAWADTCCIDKSSSAELSEAINSMYAWYRDARVCYVFMDDVSHADSPFEDDSQFVRSVWHTRGWTLQELLAPHAVEFYSKEWLLIGTKSELTEPLEMAAGIERDILTGSKAIRDASIAQRMSWASTRVTTRVEDTAYCLMGLFDVNMAVFYGEGNKAFRRLQEEIMRDSNDQSLFVWEYSSVDDREGGLLASHPRNFLDSGRFEDKSGYKGFKNLSYEAVKGGISISVFLSEWDNSERYHAVLTCTENNQNDCYARIMLQKTGRRSDEYVRVGSPIRYVERGRISGSEKTVVVLHESPPKLAEILDAPKYFMLHFIKPPPNLPSALHDLKCEALTADSDPDPIHLPSARDASSEENPRNYTCIHDRTYRVTDPGEYAYELQRSRAGPGRKKVPCVSELERRFGLHSMNTTIKRQRINEEIMRLRFSRGGVYSHFLLTISINAKGIPEIFTFPESMPTQEYENEFRLKVARGPTERVMNARRWGISFPPPASMCNITLHSYSNRPLPALNGSPTLLLSLAD